MNLSWFINLIGLIFSIIGITNIRNSSYHIFLIIGLSIQTVAVLIYYVNKYIIKKNNGKI